MHLTEEEYLTYPDIPDLDARVKMTEVLGPFPCFEGKAINFALPSPDGEHLAILGDRPIVAIAARSQVCCTNT